MYSRKDANLLRDHLIDRALNNATVKKQLNTLRTIVNFTNRECGLKDINSFSGMYFGERELNIETKRKPIPLPDHMLSVLLCSKQMDYPPTRRRHQFCYYKMHYVSKQTSFELRFSDQNFYAP